MNKPYFIARFKTSLLVLFVLTFCTLCGSIQKIGLPAWPAMASDGGVFPLSDPVQMGNSSPFLAQLASPSDLDGVRATLFSSGGRATHAIGTFVMGRASESALERTASAGLVIRWWREGVGESESGTLPDGAGMAVSVWNSLVGPGGAWSLVSPAAAPSGAVSSLSTSQPPLEQGVMIPVIPLPGPEMKDIEEPAMIPHDLPDPGLESPAQASFKPQGATDSQTSSYLLGKVVVVALLPESDGTSEPSTENWTSGQVTSVHTALTEALDEYAALNPNAGLTFIHEYPSDPPSGGQTGTVRTGYEAITRPNFDSTCIDDLMTRLGASGADYITKLRSYAHGRREFNDADWAFVAIVKNNAATGGGRASAFRGGPALCVFANTPKTTVRHETSHVFGAIDEYHPDAAQSPVLMGGYLYGVNANSQYDDDKGYNDGAGEGIPAMMVNSTDYLSPFSRIMIGWTDQDGDGIPDLRDTFPAVAVDGVTGTNPYTVTGTATVKPFLAVSDTANSINRISRVQWRLDGLTWNEGVLTGGDPGQRSFTFTTPTLPAGTYNLEIRAQNTAGNWSVRPKGRQITAAAAGTTNAAPFAAMAVKPEAGSVSTQFLFTAAPSTDLEDQSSSLRFRWDWESDGIWDTVLSFAREQSHVYATAGTKTVTLQVTDSNSNTTQKTMQVAVSSSNEPPRAAFSVADGTARFGSTAVSYTFDAGDSWDPETPAASLQYRWDFDGDSTWDTSYSTETQVTRPYTLPDVRFALQKSPDSTSNAGYDLLVSGDRAYVATLTNGINVYDVSTKTNPTLIKSISANNAFSLAISGGYLLAACYNDGLRIIDIDPIESAVEVARTPTTFVSDVIVADNYAYLANGYAGLTILDVTNPAAPTTVKTLSLENQSAGSLAKDGNYVYVATGDGKFRIVNVTTPASASQVGAIATGYTTETPYSIAFSGNHAYSSVYGKGFAVIDVSVKSSPSLVKRVDTVTTLKLGVRGSVLFAGSPDGIFAFSLDNPADPTKIRGKYSKYYAIKPVADDTWLYCGVSGYDLAIFKYYVGSPAASQSWNVKLEVKDGAGAVSNCTRTVWACPYDSVPTASFTVTPATGTTGTNILLDASASSDANSATTWDGKVWYRWDYEGDGNFDTPFSETQSTIYHTYSEPGVYKAILEVRDRFNAIGRAERTVTISSTGTDTAPTAAMVVSTSAPLRAGSPITFDASGSSDAQTGSGDLQVRWDFQSDGIWDTPFSTVKTASFTYDNPGSVTVRVQVRDNGGLRSEAETSITLETSVAGPSSAVTYPVNGSVLSTIAVINGSATDPTGTVNKVEISVTDGTSYLKADNTWGAGETWVQVTGTTTWTHAVSGVTFETGKSFLVKSRATNSLGAVESPGSGITFVISTGGGPATSCVAPAITSAASLTLTVSCDVSTALVKLWYRKEGDASYTDSGITRTGAGSMIFNLPATGTFQFYTTGTADSVTEAPPATPDATVTYRSDLPVAGKIRLTYDTVSNYWFQLNEIEVWGTAGSAGAAKLTPTGVTVSSPAYGAYSETRLIDGLVQYNNDFVASNPTLPFTIEIDLGALCFVDHLVHYNDGQYGAPSVKVEIDGTSAGSAWTTFGTFNNLTLTSGTPNPDTLATQAKVLINEVYPGAVPFVEIFNSGAGNVNLSGWSVKFDSQTFTFGSVVLGGRAHIVLREGSGTGTSTVIFTEMDMPWSQGDPGSVSLLDSGGVGVDFVRWGVDTVSPPTGTAWSGQNPDPPILGKALARDTSSTDTDRGSDWVSANPTMGTANESTNTFLISGQILDENSQPVAGVTLTLTGGSQTVSDGNGFYAMPSLSQGTYTVTPSKSGLGFTPAQTTVTVGPDATGKDFAAAPAAGTFSISGTIKQNGIGLADVTVSISGAGSIKTAASGYFYIPGLSASSYVVIPSRTGYSFTPASVSVTLGPSAKDKNFTAVPGGDTFGISGHIMTTSGDPVEGVTVEAGTKKASTDESGFYLLPALAAGTYTVTPSQTGYTFNPVTRSITLGPDATGSDFTAFDNGFHSRRLTGRYFKLRYRSFNDPKWLQMNELIFYGGNVGAETVAMIPIFAITPSMAAYPGYGVEKLYDGKTVVNGDFAVNISGYTQFELVVDLGDEKSIDRIIHVNDGAYGAKSVDILVSKTSPGGDYALAETFLNLKCPAGAAGEDYLLFKSGKVCVNEIDLSTAGYVELKNTGTTDIDLGGWKMSAGGVTYTFTSRILGRDEFLSVKNGHGVDSGNELYLKGTFNWAPGSKGEVSLKDELGGGVDFVRWGSSIILPPSGTYWYGPNPVPPASGYSLSRDKDSADTDKGTDFKDLKPTPMSANVPTLELSGFVRTSSGTPVPGVSVEIAGIDEVATDSIGKYKLDLPPGTYTVVPRKTGYDMTPQSRSVTLTSANVPEINFTATGGATTFFISGYVLGADGKGLGGVSVSLGGAGSASSESGTGFWIVSNLAAGTYTATPARSGYTFSPTFTQATIGPSKSGVDFTGSGSAGPVAVWVDSGFLAGSEDGTESRPYRTITAAANAAAQGALIRVRAGRYGESVVLKSGQTLSGDGAFVTQVDGGGSSVAVVTLGDGGKVTGLTVSGATAATAAYGIVINGVNGTVENVISTANSRGMQIKGGSGTVRNSTIYGNSGGGLYLETGGDLRADSSIFSDIQQGGGAASAVDYCDIAGGGLWASLGTGNIVAGPLFEDTDGRDFRLSGSSPCVNSGNPAADRNDPDGTRNDIGALGGPGAGEILEIMDVASLSVSKAGWPGYGKEKLVDGIKKFNGDFAVQSPPAGFSIVLDFGADRKIGKIHLYNDGSYGCRSATIYGALDSSSTSFTQIGVYGDLVNIEGYPVKNIIDFPDLTARYIKIVPGTFSNPTWFQLNEIEVFGEISTSSGETERIIPVLVSSPSTPLGSYGFEKLSNGTKIYNSEFVVKNPGTSVTITLDLGRDTAVSEVKSYNDGSYGARTVSLSSAASADGESFTTIDTYTGLDVTPERVNEDILTFTARTVRLLRLSYSSMATSAWFQLGEIEVYATPSGSTRVPVVSATVSVSAYPGYEISKVHNGTRHFNSEFACRNSAVPVEVVLDLGVDAAIDRIVNYNDGMYGSTRVSIYTATEAAPTVFSTVLNDVNMEAAGSRVVDNPINFTERTARYVKLHFTKFGDPVWFQLAEIEIYRTTQTSEPQTSARIESIGRVVGESQPMRTKELPGGDIEPKPDHDSSTPSVCNSLEALPEALLLSRTRESRTGGDIGLQLRGLDLAAHKVTLTDDPGKFIDMMLSGQFEIIGLCPDPQPDLLGGFACVHPLGPWLELAPMAGFRFFEFANGSWGPRAEFASATGFSSVVASLGGIPFSTDVARSAGKLRRFDGWPTLDRDYLLAEALRRCDLLDRETGSECRALLWRLNDLDKMTLSGSIGKSAVSEKVSSLLLDLKRHMCNTDVNQGPMIPAFWYGAGILGSLSD